MMTPSALHRPDHRHPVTGPGDPPPRSGRPAQFLFTRHGKRLLGRTRLRAELEPRRARCRARPHVSPHQLRHTYATALVNAGVSLQSPDGLLGHVSAEMSLRYGRLFDTTVRAEYERALSGPRRTSGRGRPHAGGRHACRYSTRLAARPGIKSRLAGGYCLRAPAQEPAPTPTSASTAPTSAPTPATCPSCTPSGLPP